MNGGQHTDRREVHVGRRIGGRELEDRGGLRVYIDSILSLPASLSVIILRQNKSKVSVLNSKCVNSSSL